MQCHHWFLGRPHIASIQPAIRLPLHLSISDASRQKPAATPCPCLNPSHSSPLPYPIHRVFSLPAQPHTLTFPLVQNRLGHAWTTTL
jgi:hypothetical protein